MGWSDVAQRMGGVRKRKAEADINNDRLTKRLESLKLEAQAKVRPQLYEHIHRRPPVPAPVSVQDVTPPASAPIEGDDMAIDDTKHRVYISNLSAEIAEIEAAEAAARTPIFIPDVEKRLLEQRLLEQRIPIPVYANKDGELGGMNRDQALVLYDVPRSLTVEEGKDSVRKAILEARRRAQEKAGLATSGRIEDTRTAIPATATTNDLDIDDGVEPEPMALEDEDENGDVMEID